MSGRSAVAVAAASHHTLPLLRSFGVLIWENVLHFLCVVWESLCLRACMQSFCVCVCTRGKGTKHVVEDRGAQLSSGYSIDAVLKSVI